MYKVVTSFLEVSRQVAYETQPRFSLNIYVYLRFCYASLSGSVIIVVFVYTCMPPDLF